jgi:hypothetical protein
VVVCGAVEPLGSDGSWSSLVGDAVGVMVPVVSPVLGGVVDSSVAGAGASSRSSPPAGWTGSLQVRLYTALARHITLTMSALAVCAITATYDLKPTTAPDYAVTCKYRSTGKGGCRTSPCARMEIR